ncbi:Na+/H+ antiporter family protein [Campylobacter sp.]|uniref:Na+/H+ antiporter family protein n=1 Tax=Campylobacter sp. TaxID=205 RepID=UPI002A5F0D16|nr:Na+/H+ antiporter NhaC family protein [Campylobacter sp.]MDD7703828.1 Na+/H+ antiporter NhaC family protein [Campylobacteraceae bacterium]MDY2635241.1 Na+/H+ antiporter NhaC family protein [Campylobacter sp.]
MLTNPVLLSVLLMCVLCLLRFNVILAIIASALLAGVLSGASIEETASTLISGMSANLETALSYILLGALAVAIWHSNLADIIITKISHYLSKKRTWLIFAIAGVACCSQNIVPIHIAFIPVLIPPLLALFNSLKIDRRAIACALTFGLKAPYVSLSVGFGLIFHTIIKDNLASNGVDVSIRGISSVMWIGGVSMLVGLILAVFFYRKPRVYENRALDKQSQQEHKDKTGLKMRPKEWAILGGLAVALGVQLYTNSMALGGFFGIIFMIIFGGISYKHIDDVMLKGLTIMSFVAFVILIAGGFAAVLKSTGGIEELVNVASLFAGGKLGGAIIMLGVGLLVTMGIGSSFGTIPILAVIYVPLCQSLGFSVEATILLIGIAAALGDAGSPASDSTLGPTSGLNADSQHSHIYDTCVPTFLFFNIPLVIGALIFSVIL